MQTIFMKRLFAALKINPEENFTQVYFKIRTQLKNEKINWVDLNNIHITLKFFGETDENQIPQISNSLRNRAKITNPFNINITGVGVFGSSYKPRVLWFGLGENDPLLNLGLNVLGEMDKIGFTRDRQNFRPHLTIGRIKYIVNRNQFNEVIAPFKNMEIQQIHIKEMFLFESILKPDGPVYRVIDSFSFK